MAEIQESGSKSNSYIKAAEHVAHGALDAFRHQAHQLMNSDIVAPPNHPKLAQKYIDVRLMLAQLEPLAATNQTGENQMVAPHKPEEPGQADASVAVPLMRSQKQLPGSFVSADPHHSESLSANGKVLEIPPLLLPSAANVLELPPVYGQVRRSPVPRARE